MSRTPAIPRLGDLARGRDNNLNLLRVVAASAVLVSHSFPLSSGDPSSEPWGGVPDLTPGTVAVDVFFLISGFLVTASLLKSGRLRDFFVARGLRIYPGLWVALLVTVMAVVLGGYTSLGLTEFWGEGQTWRYLLRNAFMLAGAEDHLPGAFAHNPYAEIVNGSLWTLRWELRMYLALAAIWWLVRLGGAERQGGERWLLRILPGLAAGLVAACLVLSVRGQQVETLRLGAMFFTGAAAWTLRDRIELRDSWAAMSLAGLVLAYGASAPLFELAYRVLLPYLIFYLAYVPGGWVRGFNRWSDCSYGIYIYAFPIQQMLMARHPQLSPVVLTAWAGGLTLAMAWLSWHGIEKPALGLRHALAQKLSPRLS